MFTLLRFQPCSLSAFGFRHADNIDELRDRGQYAVLTPAETRQLAEERGYINLSPLAGGIPADTAWESLRLIESEILKPGS